MSEELSFVSRDDGFLRGDLVTIDLPGDALDGKRLIVTDVPTPRTIYVRHDNITYCYCVGVLRHV